MIMMWIYAYQINKSYNMIYVSLVAYIYRYQPFYSVKMDSTLNIATKMFAEATTVDRAVPEDVALASPILYFVAIDSQY